ncbi:MAG: HAMP domain-containing protein [Burkholderiales bacterium]|nr:HAMP domain-containing protein [Burkholderiales bacterium]
MLVVDESGRDVLGRTVPPGALASAREQLGNGSRASGVRKVAAPDGRVLVVFAPAPERVARPAHARPRALRPLPDDRLALQLGIALVASLAFSAGLAWYLARPVRHLRRASRRLADGAFDTRVAPVLGRRRDEIADLGRDFDHMAARLQALVEAQKRLLHDVSHELRSPLARLQVAVGLARQQPERLESALERIERETARLDALVGELLTLSRLEAGVTGAPAGVLDAGELLEEIVADARFEAEAAGCRVELQLRGALAVHGRDELLRRALENVIRNAVRYTARDTVVEVSAARDAVELAITVCDRGPGVPEAELDRLFEPFFSCRARRAAGRLRPRARDRPARRGGAQRPHSRIEPAGRRAMRRDPAARRRGRCGVAGGRVGFRCSQPGRGTSVWRIRHRF